nr:hypothetical protein [Oscillochloris sp. ZM17-4]
MRWEGSIDPDREVRDLAPPLGLLEDKDDLLGAAEREGRDQHVATPLDGRRHLGAQALLLHAPRRVRAPAIGGLQNQQVGLGDERRLGTLDGALRGDADIAGDDDAPLGVLQAHAHGPSDVAGQTQRDDQAGDLGDGVAIIDRQRRQTAQHLLNRRAIVQRQLQLLGGALLHHGDGVGQHDRHEPDAGGGSVDRRARELLVKDRQGADMVGVGVGDHDRRDVRALQGGEIGEPLLGGPTHTHASIDHKPRFAEAHGDAACANLRSPAEKGNVKRHGYPAWVVVMSVREDRHMIVNLLYHCSMAGRGPPAELWAQLRRPGLPTVVARHAVPNIRPQTACGPRGTPGAYCARAQGRRSRRLAP